MRLTSRQDLSNRPNGPSLEEAGEPLTRRKSGVDRLSAAPYNPRSPVSQADQVLWFDAVPLLLVAAAYLGVAAMLGRLGAARRLDAPTWVFATVAVAATAYGVTLTIDRDPPPGGAWPTLAVAVLLLVPAVLALTRRTPATRGQVGGRDIESMAAIATAFTGTDDAAAVARELLERVEPLVSVELACLFLVDDEAREASGVIGRVGSRELDWFPDLRIDLEHEPSGVATAVYEAAPVAVYDAEGSKIVSKRLVAATGVKSAAFVPLLADRRVIGVLVVGTTSEPRAFSSEELMLLQTVAGEAALALARTRSSAALDDALERERFVARISARVRSELDVDKLLGIAVEETGIALEVDRCFIRL